VLTDPIADMLTRIRNANQALHDTVDMPNSRVKKNIALLLQEEGYIAGVEEVDERTLRVRLRYDSQRRRVLSGIRRESKPGRRVYLASTDVPRVLGGMGIAVVSTSQGLLTGQEARRRGIGGELVCTVW
jgi:small subunit ribosomal protein S8